MDTKQDIVNKILNYFDEGYACSQSMLLGFADKFNLDKEQAKLIASAFGGGMGRMRRTCGALTGAFMVIGLKYGNSLPNDMDRKLFAYKKVRELTARFEEVNGTSNCNEILKQFATDKEIQERKHHKIICRKVVGDVASILFNVMHDPK